MGRKTARKAKSRGPSTTSAAATAAAAPGAAAAAAAAARGGGHAKVDPEVMFDSFRRLAIHGSMLYEDIDCRSFREIFEYLNPNVSVPTRDELAAHVASTYALAKAKIKGALTTTRAVGNAGHVSISTEVWFEPCCSWVQPCAKYPHGLDLSPSPFALYRHAGRELHRCKCGNRKAYLAVAAHWIDPSTCALRSTIIDFSDCSYPRSKGEVSAERVRKIVEECVRDWRIEGRVVAMVTDETPKSLEILGACFGRLGVMEATDESEAEAEAEAEEEAEAAAAAAATAEVATVAAAPAAAAGAAPAAAEANTASAAAEAGAAPKASKAVADVKVEGVSEASPASAVSGPLSQQPAHVLCYGRALAHAARSVLELKEFPPIMKKMLALSSILGEDGNSLMRSAFQRVLSCTSPNGKDKDFFEYGVVEDVTTNRWDGTFELFDGLLKMRLALNAVFPKMRQPMRQKTESTAEEWALVAEVARCLRPFVDLTRKLGVKPLPEWSWKCGSAGEHGHHPSLHTMIPLFGRLLEEVRVIAADLRVSATGEEVRALLLPRMEAAVEVLQQRWQQMGPVEVAALALDPRLKLKYFETGMGREAMAVESVVEVIVAMAEKQNGQVLAAAAPASAGGIAAAAAAAASAAAPATTTATVAAAARGVPPRDGVAAAPAATTELDPHPSCTHKANTSAVQSSPRSASGFPPASPSPSLVNKRSFEPRSSTQVLRERVMQEISAYASEPLLEADKADELRFWLAAEGKLPLLRRLALKVMAVPASTMRTGRFGDFGDQNLDDLRQVKGGRGVDMTMEHVRYCECLRYWLDQPECRGL